MENIQALYREISTIMDTIVDVTADIKLSRHIQDDKNNTRIWQYHLNLPLDTHYSFLIILPDQAHKISNDFLLSLKNTNYYIVDCFGTHGDSEHSCDPRFFFIHFIFDSRGYNNFFESTPIFKDISKLYVERTISFFSDYDSLESTEKPVLEQLMSYWIASSDKPLLILGDRGMGKTWAVLNFCRKYYKKHRENPWMNPVPLYINLRSLSEQISGVTNIGELLYHNFTNTYKSSFFGGYSLFSILLKLGKIIVVFDGLDEMSKEVTDELIIKNIWQIFSIYSETSKFILTSRNNFFNSRNQIREHFAYKSFVKQIASGVNPKSIVYNSEERRVRQDFNIWEIKDFRDYEKKILLSKIKSLSNENLAKGLSRLDNLATFESGTIQYELSQLTSIPAYYSNLLRYLSSDRFPSLVDIYETCINDVVIGFNIESDRAIDSYRLLIKGKTLESISFEIEQKNQILRKLSWYMIERDINEFDIVEFPRFIKEIEDIDYETVLSDLQTQTVITLKEKGKYSFNTKSIFAFYVANHIFLLLNSTVIEATEKGVQSLGRYDFRENEVLKTARIFLSAKIKALKKSKDGQRKIADISDRIIGVYKESRAYSPWLKFLSSNAKTVGIPINNIVLRKYDYWINHPISKVNSSIDKNMVLIPGERSIGLSPFFIGITEVTNKQFSKFLQDKKFGDYWKRRSIFGENVEFNPYTEIINYYHIIFWKKDQLPKGKEDHPIVWVSWYAAAMYCNWLSDLEGEDRYYNFDLSKKFEKMTIDSNSSGYRLPNEQEWMFTAREGNLDANTILEIYQDQKDKEKIRRKFGSDNLKTTNSVMGENPNKYGIYGLIGNVREWVDNVKTTELTIYDKQIIKGMGWLLGEEGFEFEHKTNLIAQNNNIDVGFRIARNLKPEEKRNLELATKK